MQNLTSSSFDALSLPKTLHHSTSLSIAPEICRLKFADELAISQGSSIRGTGDDSDMKRAIPPESRAAKTSFRSSSPLLLLHFVYRLRDTRRRKKNLKLLFLFCPRFGLELLPRNMCLSGASERETFLKFPSEKTTTTKRAQ